VSQFIANSNAGARFLTDKLNVDSARVRVIQNGIVEGVAALDRRAWREQLEIDHATFVACMVGNLHWNKDHATLLKAWREVVRELSGAVLVLAGRHDGAYESLRALCHEMEIDHAVRFVGPVDDVPGLLSAVNVGVFSSRSEGCPNGVLECMAAGLAVAGTNIEGVRDVVGPRGASLLAPPGDAHGLAQMIFKLAGNPDLCSTLGEENRRRIREHFDWQRMCEDTVSYLSASLEWGGGGGRV
jgi:glycosyltransferase involved in cell wall biosynthesis